LRGASVGEGEENVLQGGALGVEIVGRDVLVGEVTHDRRQQVVAPSHLHAPVGDVYALHAVGGPKSIRVKRGGSSKVDSVGGVEPVDEGVGRVERHAPALMHHGDPVAERLRLVHEVGHEDDGRALGAELADEPAGALPGLRVEAGRDLIEHHEVGLVHQREGHEEPLLLAAGEGVERGVPLVRQAPPVEERVTIGRLGVEGGEEVEGFADRDAVGQGGLLQLGAHPSVEPVGRRLLRVHAEHAHGARIGPTQAQRALDGRRFARAVGADEAEDLAHLHLQRQVIDGDRGAVRFAERLEGKGRRHGSGDGLVDTDEIGISRGAESRVCSHEWGSYELMGHEDVLNRCVFGRQAWCDS
jgi:hypothetical protein